MAKKDKPHIKKFYKDIQFATVSSISYVLGVIRDLKEEYPQYADEVIIKDIQITETYGYEDRITMVKYMYRSKPNKGLQEMILTDFDIQEIIDRWL